MSVILICPKKEDKKSSTHNPRFSEYLGLGYIAAYLNGLGINTKIINAEISGISENDIIEDVLLSNPQLIGISATANDLRKPALNLVKRLKNLRPSIHITIGGQYATLNYAELIKNEPKLDSIILGDGEMPMAQLYFALVSNKPLQRMDSIILQSNAQEGNRKLSRVENLDELPHPIRCNFDSILNSEQRMPILSSRGCHGGCSFCTLSDFNGKYRAREPEKVVDEIHELYAKGARRFRFVDENFFGFTDYGQERGKQIAELILKRNLKISFKILARIDDIRKDTIIFLKNAGLDTISIGVESYNQRQLDLYGKGYTPDKIDQTLSLLNIEGIKVFISFIMYDPFINVEELSNNLEFIKKHITCFEPKRVFSKLKPEKGTRLGDTLIESGHVFEKDNSYEIRFRDPKSAMIYSKVKSFKSKWGHIETSYYKLREAYRFDIEKNNLLGRLPSHDLFIEDMLSRIRIDLLNTYISFSEWAIAHYNVPMGNEYEPKMLEIKNRILFINETLSGK